MESATQIKSDSFGMMDENGKAQYSSWKAYLQSVINKSNSKEKENLECELNKIPDVPQAAFVITDCNAANFIFEEAKLKCAIDIERPLWGDQNFLYGVIKARNPFMYELIENRMKPTRALIDFYSKVYGLIFS